MNNSNNDTPTGHSGGGPRIARVPQVADQQPLPQPAATTDASIRRWNLGRDIAAGALLLVALTFPWNLYFGLEIPNSNHVVWGLLIAATVLSLAAIPLRASGLRLALNAPYVLLVVGFVVFDAIQSVRYGGSVNVPGGVGAGAWLGIAGALLSAQPILTGSIKDPGRFARWRVFAQFWGYAAIVVAAMSFLFNLVWRIRYAVAGADGSAGFDVRSVAVIITAVVYGVAALTAVVVASRLILRRDESARLVTIALGASTLAAGMLVWALPLGRELDAFHGIAQNTSTAGVGYEGYLAWVAAAAIFAPLTLRTVLTARPLNRAVLQRGVQDGLLLIVVWGFASTAMRITDLAVEVSLDFPYSRYDSMVLAAFDLATAVLALWLRANLGHRTLPVRLVWALSGFVFALTISRVVMGVALAPRFEGSARAAGPVYGNNLAQQITSTFDVVLCGVALCLLALALLDGAARPTPASVRVGTPTRRAGWHFAHPRGSVPPRVPGQPRSGA